MMIDLTFLLGMVVSVGASVLLVVGAFIPLTGGREKRSARQHSLHKAHIQRIAIAAGKRGESVLAELNRTEFDRPREAYMWQDKD